MLIDVKLILTAEYPYECIKTEWRYYKSPPCWFSIVNAHVRKKILVEKFIFNVLISKDLSNVSLKSIAITKNDFCFHVMRLFLIITLTCSLTKIKRRLLEILV